MAQIKQIKLPTVADPYDLVDDGAVRYDSSQSLTADQKTQARTNIGAGTSNFSGNYNDLTNKPTIPTVNDGTLTMQVNGTQKAVFTANQASGVTFNVTTADLGLPNIMNFVGVSTTDPKGSSGATVDGHSVWKKGDVVIYSTKEFVLKADSNIADNWVELGDEGSHALKTITITGTGVLSGGGDLTTNRQITHNTSGATAGTYGDSTAQTPGFGGTFKDLCVTVNDTGHVTSISEHNVTIPSTVATTSANGLMSSADKTKLGGIAESATAVSVSDSGTATDEVQYITINGVEKKLAGGGGTALTVDDYLTDAELNEIIGSEVIWDGSVA